MTTALVAALLAPGLALAPAQAVDNPGELVVQIVRLTPAIPRPNDDVTVTGVVRNPERYSWTRVRVYPAVAKTPFVTRRALRAAIASGATYTGERIVARGADDNLGTLRPGQSRRFSITIRASQLGLAGANAVYPLGIHALAIGPDGVRPVNAVGRANTFLPVLSATARPRITRAPTTVLWPFLLPGQRSSTGTYAQNADLARSIGPHGQLRNLLNLARTTPRRGSDVVVDPSLLQAVRGLSRVGGKSATAVGQRKNAKAFLDDLSELADHYSCAAVGYDRPDILAIDASSAAKDLTALIDQATTGTLDQDDMSCLRIEWPPARGIDRRALTTLRRQGTAAAIVSPWLVPGWDATRGNILIRKTAAGDLPLVVYDRLDDGVPGAASPATLRQIILAESLFTSLAAGRDAAKVSTVVVVDPRFNPGTVSGQPLAAAFSSAMTDPQNFKASLESRRTPYEGVIPETAETKPLSQAQLAVAGDTARTAELIDGMLLDDDDRTGHAQAVASLVSQRWRKHGITGLKAAQHVYSGLNHELADISVDGPPALTLSSGAGQFPLTVGNGTPHRLRVGLAIDSSAPGVKFRAPRTIAVAAGESRTITVNVDMATQSATTVTARLSAANGEEFGAATDFNVRSSQVGAALWIAIGLSTIFVVVALIRRFARPGHRPTHPSLAPDDFDD